jgi:hypothetical protein
MLTSNIYQNMKENESNMRGLIIFVVFFAIFSSSSFLIPSPLFPGNIVCLLLMVFELSQVALLSAFVNGVFYGLIAWVVCKLGLKWVERSYVKKKIGQK